MEFTKLRLLVLAASASLGSCALGAGPMTKAPLPPVASLNRLNQTIDKVAADGNSTDGSCVANCSFVLDQQQPTLYKWVELSYTSTFTAATLFYIINTEASLTRTQLVPNTSIPPNASPPKVDSNGFRFEEVSMPGGPVKVTYPTSFINWGSTYRWSGVLFTKASPGATDTCVTHTADVTVTLSSNPQPTAGSAAPGDPKGLRSALLPLKDPTLRKEFAYLFKPDQVAFENCSNFPDPPQPPMSLAIAWETWTTTKTEGAPGVPSPTHSGPLNLGSSTAEAPHVPDETQSAMPVQGGQVVQSSGPADHQDKPLSIIAAPTAKAGASVIAGSIPSSATSKGSPPSNDGSPQQGKAQEAAAVPSVASPSVFGLAGLVVFLVACKLWV